MYAYSGNPKFQGQEFPENTPYYPCSGDLDNAELEGMEAIEAAYNTCVENTELGNNFELCGVINGFAKRTLEESHVDHDFYKILFVLTPMDIGDIEDLKRKLIEHSNLPMSIVFVEMTDTPLKNMRTLDPAKPVKNPLLIFLRSKMEI